MGTVCIPDQTCVPVYTALHPPQTEPNHLLQKEKKKEKNYTMHNIFKACHFCHFKIIAASLAILILLLWGTFPDRWKTV